MGRIQRTQQRESERGAARIDDPMVAAVSASRRDSISSSAAVIRMPEWK
jgi:hypothetical protein